MFEPQAVVPSKSNLRQTKQLAQLHFPLRPSDEATCKCQGPCKCLRARECQWLPSGSFVGISIELFIADSGCPHPLVVCTSAGLPVSSLLPRLVRQRSRQLLRQHVGRCLRRPPPIQLCPFEKLILTCRQGSWHLRWESSPGFRCMHSGCRSCCLDHGQLVVLVEVSMRKTAAPSPYDKVPAQVVRPATLCPESTIETSHASFISIHQRYIATLYLMYTGGTLSPSQH